MTPRRLAFGFFFASIIALAVHGIAAQQPDRVRVIIGLRQAAGPNDEAMVTGAGGTVRRTFWLVPAIAAEVPQAALQGLRNNPRVSSVDLDVTIFTVDAELDAAWGVKRIGAGIAHAAGNKGSGIKVCVVDTGVAASHPDLAANILGGYDFVNDDFDPSDDRGHGTHVAGTILGADNNSGVVGVAPAAQLLSYKILDQNGQGSFSDAISALQECLASGGQVANHSYGSSGDPGPTVQAAFDNAEALGLVNVAAAGNLTKPIGTCAVGYPARYSSVIAVTATSSTDQIAPFSCRGPEAELAAPGVSVVSTVPTGTCALCSSTGYLSLNGTSMASPHVAGVAALVIASGITDANGNGRKNDEVRQRLRSTADDLGTVGLDSLYGFGLVDADEAAASGSSGVPVEPSGLDATAVSSSRIDLNWLDNSSNESGFAIERCSGSSCSNFTQVGTVGANVTTFADTSLAAETTFRYRVRAQSAGGNSAYSNIDSATTSAASGLSLEAVGRKVKSQKLVDLTWTGTSATNVDVFRNGVRIVTTGNDGSHTDSITAKGGGTYSYTVCEADTSICSNSAPVTF